MNTVAPLFYFLLYGLFECSGMKMSVTGASNGPIRLYAQLSPEGDSVCSLITPIYEGCKKMKLLEAPFAPSLDHPYYIDHRMVFVKEAGFLRATKNVKDKKAGFVQIRVKLLAEQEYPGFEMAQRNQRTLDTIKEMKNSVLSDILLVTHKSSSYKLCFSRITFPGDHDYNDEDTFDLKLELVHKFSEYTWAMSVDGILPAKARLNPIRSLDHFCLTTMLVGHPKSCLNFYPKSNETDESGPYMLEIRPANGALVTLMPLLDPLMRGDTNVLPTGNAINRIRISPTKKGDALVRLYSNADFVPEEIDEMFQELDDTSVGYVSHHSTSTASKIYYVRLSTEQNYCLVCYLNGDKKKQKKIAYGFSVPVKNYEMLKELIDSGILRPGVMALKFQTYNNHGGYEMVSKVEVKGGIRAFGEVLKALVAVVFYRDFVGVADCVQSIGFELDKDDKACIEIVFSNRALEARGSEALSDAMNKSIFELKDAINALSLKNSIPLEKTVNITPPMPQIDITGVYAYAGSGNNATFLTSDYWVQLTKGQLKFSEHCFSGDKFIILSKGIDFSETFNYKITSIKVASKTFLSQVMHYLNSKSFIIVDVPENDIDRCSMSICTFAEDGDRQMSILNKSHANKSEQMLLVLPWIVNSSLDYGVACENSIRAEFEFYDKSNINVFLYYLADMVPSITSVHIQHLPKVSKVLLITDEASLEMAYERLKDSDNLAVSLGNHKYAILEKPSHSLAFFDRKPVPFTGIERLLAEKSKCQAPKSGLIPVKITRNNFEGDLEAKIELAEWRFDKTKINPKLRLFIKTLMIDGPAEMVAAFSEIRFVPSQQNFKVKVFLSKKLCGTKTGPEFREIIDQIVSDTLPVKNVVLKKNKRANRKGLKANSQQSEEDVKIEAAAIVEDVPVEEEVPEQVEEQVTPEVKEELVAAEPVVEMPVTRHEIEPKQQVFITLLANTLQSNLADVPLSANYESDLLDAALSFSPSLRCPFQATYGNDWEGIYDWEGFCTVLESMLHHFREAPIGPFEISPAEVPKAETTINIEHDFSLENTEALLSAFEQLAYHMLLNNNVLIVGIIIRSETVASLFVTLSSSMMLSRDETVEFVSCMDLAEYGNVRLFAKSTKEAGDAPYKYVVADLEDAIMNDALECPFAPLAGPLFTEIEYYMLRDRAFYKRFAPRNPFPSKLTVTMKLGMTKVIPSPKPGKAFFETMLKEFVKYPKYNSAYFKVLPNGKTQLCLYEEISSDITVEELLSEATVTFPIETGHSGTGDIWELNLKDSFGFFFAPIETAAQLGIALNFVGSKTKELLLTNRYYRKNEKFSVVQFDHQEDTIHRLMPVLQDIFACDFTEAFGSKIAAISFVPRSRRNSGLFRLHFVGSELNTNNLMQWAKSLEACGIGYVHEIISDKGVYGFLLRNRLLRVLQPLDHKLRRDSLLYGATHKDDFALVLKRIGQEKPGVALRYGHLACSEAHLGVVAAETSLSDAYDAFRFVVDTLNFDNVGNLAPGTESIVLEFTEEKAIIRVVFLFDVLESLGEAALLKLVEAVDFGLYNKQIIPPEGPQIISAFVSNDGQTAYPLGKDFWKSVTEEKFFSPKEIFSNPENINVQLLLISPEQIPRGLSDVRIVATDEIEYADLTRVMDLVNEESIIRVRHSSKPGYLKIDVGRWEMDPTSLYMQIGLKLCAETRIRSMEQYLCVKPWTKSARFPEDAACETNSLSIQFLEGSQHLVQKYIKDIIESDMSEDGIALELGNLSFVRVYFSDIKYVKVLRMKMKSKGISYQTIAKNHLALLGDLPLFATFTPSMTVSQFRNIHEFMKIKAGVVNKVPCIGFTIERRSTDPLLQAEQIFYTGGFPLKRYNTVLSSFIQALTEKSFPDLALPFARLEVTVHHQHFKVKVYVKEYLGGLGAEAYGKLLVQAAAHLEKHPGAKGKIGNPALRPVKKPSNSVLVENTPAKKPVKSLTKSKSVEAEQIQCLPGNDWEWPSFCDALKGNSEVPFKQTAPATIASQVVDLESEPIIPVVLTPEEEKDWSCYYDMIKEETEFDAAKDALKAQYVELVKKSSLQFRPDLGEGYRFLFSADGPIAVAKSWNGFAVVMKLAMYALEVGLRDNSLDDACIIQVQPALLNQPCITYTHCFQVSAENGSVQNLLDTFESMAFNMMHDSIASNVIRIGVSPGQSDSLYHIFADIILPAEITPEYTSAMAEFDFIWENLVIRGSI